MRSKLVEQAVGVVMRENACDAPTATLNLHRSAVRHHIAVEEVATMVLTIEQHRGAQSPLAVALTPPRSCIGRSATPCAGRHS